MKASKLIIVVQVTDDQLEDDIYEILSNIIEVSTIVCLLKS